MHRVSLFCNKNFTLALPSFQVYNASAGSGKTHTLVTLYLKILLADDFRYHFKNILAVTFTNKAVSEMKTRIINYLRQLSSPSIITSPLPIAEVLCDVLHIDLETLNERAKKQLKYILHNYAFFDIVTIDAFNHRILRTFAYDLKIPAYFEVILDAELILEEAVERLLYKAGEDELLTKVLIDFAIEKTDDDKSWDISLDLKKTAQLLLEENHYEHIEQLKGKTLQDFFHLGDKLRSKLKEDEHMIRKIARDMLKRIEMQNLEATDFTRATLPNHFMKIASGNFNNLYINDLEKNLSEGKVYTKQLSEVKVSRIEALLPELSHNYHRLKKAIFNLKFLQNFYKNIVPLSLLNAIRDMLRILKEEQNIVLISEFNSIISEVIAEQPAPFIYERLGEKYHHYFIDEFQDTSQMQWDNLIPLISNALEGETLHGQQGTLCIVGDAKQAIYRWRGGKPEQFINLCEEDHPFQVKKEVISLPKNYRSFDEIVTFNNTFFSHIASFLTHSSYREMYAHKSEQEFNDKKGGSVTLIFADQKKDAQYHCQEVLNYIQETLKQGFGYSDICVLTRKKKEGIQIADYLLKHGINIVSSETLLLKNNTKIKFLIDLMHYFLQPHDKTHVIKLLQFLSDREDIVKRHQFFNAFLDDFNRVLEQYDFDSMRFLQLSLYDAVMYAIMTFNLADVSDAYLQYFLDEVMQFMLDKGGDFSSFLTYWERKKDTLNIAAPQIPDAVQIMTIHKSKGLEFPVVIYPFAYSSIYEEQRPKIWLPLEEETYDMYGMPYALLNKNKDLRAYSDGACKRYDEMQSKLEMDQFNVLYVALTRAIQKLCIITSKDGGKNDLQKPRYFSDLFIHYLKSRQLWDDEKTSYVFGETNISVEKKEILPEVEILPFMGYPITKKAFEVTTKAASLWDNLHQDTVERATLVRYLLSQIEVASDIDEILLRAFEDGVITDWQKEEYHMLLRMIVDHELLKAYYHSLKYTVYNEREIYTSSGNVIKPDRLLTHNNQGIIINYKTGTFKTGDVEELSSYISIISTMQIVVKNAYLVYINDTIEVRLV